jgi:uncharacterized MAPEG superfamily protein
MTPLLTLVIYTTLLTFVAILGASLIRAKGWTIPGMVIAMGNRDNVPEPNAFAARADRAAKNTIEGFILFTAIALVAHASGITSPRIAQGAELFFWSRVLYLPIYCAGIPYIRTVVWTAGIFGLAMMVSALV